LPRIHPDLLKEEVKDANEEAFDETDPKCPEA
jgi:hypothetical protein